MDQKKNKSSGKGYNYNGNLHRVIAKLYHSRVKASALCNFHIFLAMIFMMIDI